jgi:DNA-directed RNA polymerase subunit M/transcription elongation factor TFIIS
MRFCVHCKSIMIYRIENAMIFKCYKCDIDEPARPEDVLLNGGFNKSAILTTTEANAKNAKKGSILIERNLIFLSRDPSCRRIEAKCNCGEKFNSLITPIGQTSYVVCPECEKYEVYT